MNINYIHKVNNKTTDNIYLQKKNNIISFFNTIWKNKDEILKNKTIEDNLKKLFCVDIDLDKIKINTRYVLFLDLDNNIFTCNFLEDYTIVKNPNYFEYKVKILEKNPFLTILIWKDNQDNIIIISNIFIEDIDNNIVFEVKDTHFSSSEIIKEKFGDESQKEYNAQLQKERDRSLLEENLNLRNSISYLDYEVDFLSNIIFELLKNQTITSEIDSTKLEEYQNCLNKLNENNVLNIKNDISKILDKKKLTRKTQEEYYKNILLLE